MRTMDGFAWLSGLQDVLDSLQTALVCQAQRIVATDKRTAHTAGGRKFERRIVRAVKQELASVVLLFLLPDGDILTVHMLRLGIADPSDL